MSKSPKLRVVFRNMRTADTVLARIRIESSRREGFTSQVESGYKAEKFRWNAL